MAETKGITISFYGETVEFDKSVDGINKALKKTQSELKEVNKSLKFDSSNPQKLQRQMELLNQKQLLLKDSIDTYKSELDKLGNYNDLTADQQKQWESLQKAILQAENDLQKVNQQLEALKGKDIRDLGKQIENIGENLNKVGEKIENIGSKFMVLTGAITGLAGAGIAYNAELEKQTTLFTTLTGSAEKAEQVLSSIKQDALGSPFDAQSLITANQYLISAGMEAENTRQTIMALGDAISATGGGNSELQRMAQNLQQVQNVGKASSMDMKQFAMAGIDIWGILAESTGKTVEELQEMDITFDMINDALIMASSEGGRYYGAMSAQAETLNGKISMLKSTFMELLGSLTESLMPIIKQVLDYLQQLVNRFQGLDDKQKTMIVKIGAMVGAIGPLLTIVGKLIGKKGIGGLVTGFGKLLQNEKVVALFTNISSAGGGLTGVLNLMKPAIESLFTPWTIIIGLFVLLYTRSEEFRTAVNNLVKALLNVFKPAIELVKSVLDVIIDVFGKVATAVTDVAGKAFEKLGDILGKFIDKATSVVTYLTDKLNPIFDALKVVLEFVYNNFILLVNAIKDDLMPRLKLLRDDIDKLNQFFQNLIDKVKELYQKFADTSFGQGFIDVMGKIGNAVQKVSGWLGGLIDDLKDANNKTSKLIANQDNASRYANSRARAVTWEGSGGLGLASGGIGITANINVTNNGTPIDTLEIKRWVSEIANEVDNELGRWI